MYVLGCCSLPTSANQAIEDGIVLADCLERHCFQDVDGALSDYYQLRHRRTKLMVDASRYLGNIMHVEHPVAKWMRDRLMAWLIGSGTLYRLAEGEIVNNCPVPYDEQLEQTLRRGWQLQ